MAQKMALISIGIVFARVPHPDWHGAEHTRPGGGDERAQIFRLFMWGKRITQAFTSSRLSRISAMGGWLPEEL